MSGALVKLLPGCHAQVSEDILVKEFLCSSQGSMRIPKAPWAISREDPTGPSFKVAAAYGEWITLFILVLSKQGFLLHCI